MRDDQAGNEDARRGIKDDGITEEGAADAVVSSMQIDLKSMPTFRDRVMVQEPELS